jgi:hypothetical protein
MALREVTFYSDTLGENQMYSQDSGVLSLTATQSSTLTISSFDFGANRCIDQDFSSSSDGFICHSDYQDTSSPTFTATLIANTPPASFRIYYRVGSSNNFPPDTATLTGGSISFSKGTSPADGDNELFVL